MAESFFSPASFGALAFLAGLSALAFGVAAALVALRAFAFLLVFVAMSNSSSLEDGWSSGEKMGSTTVAGAQVVVVTRLARKRRVVPSSFSISTSREPPSIRTVALQSVQSISVP